MPSEWDKGAAAYAGGFANFTRYFANAGAEALVARLASKADEPLALMDAAAGTGASTFALADAVTAAGAKATILATDISEGMLAVLKDNNTKTPSSVEIGTAVMSLDTLAEQPDNSLDGLLCVFGIMFVGEDQAAKATAAIHRVLKPGGVAVIITWERIQTNAIMAAAAVDQGLIKPEAEKNFLRNIMQFGDRPFATNFLVGGGFGQEGKGFSFVDVTDEGNKDHFIAVRDILPMSQTNPAIAGAVAPGKYDMEKLEKFLSKFSKPMGEDGESYVPVHGTALLIEATKST